MTDGHEWREHAACKGIDPNVFFPNGADYEEARTYCQRCCVQDACLDYAMRTGQFREGGMWGGQTPKQLRALLRSKSVTLTCDECGGRFRFRGTGELPKTCYRCRKRKSTREQMRRWRAENPAAYKARRKLERERAKARESAAFWSESA